MDLRANKQTKKPESKRNNCLTQSSSSKDRRESRNRRQRPSQEMGTHRNEAGRRKQKSSVR